MEKLTVQKLTREVESRMLEMEERRLRVRGSDAGVRHTCFSELEGPLPVLWMFDLGLVPPFCEGDNKTYFNQNIFFFNERKTVFKIHFFVSQRYF